MTSNSVDGAPLDAWIFMKRRNFARGVQDYWAGLPFDDDPKLDDNYYSYERGRQWAASAPREMPFKFGKKPNPEAIKIFEDVDIL